MANLVDWDPSRRVSILSLGGTICCCSGPAKEPVLGPDAVISGVPALANDPSIVSREVMRKDSTDLKPSDMVRLAKATHAEIQSGADGIVVLCGTDNLAQTGAAQHYLVQRSPIPIVLTGAMISIDEANSDVSKNLTDAVRVARSNLAGHMIAFHGRVLHPCRTRKRSSINVDAFCSAGAPQIAKVDGTRITLIHDPPRLRGEGDLCTSFEYEARVATHYLDIHDEQDSLSRYQQLKGLRGLVLVVLGTGGIRQDLAPSVKALRESGVVVAVVSSADSPWVSLEDYEVGTRLSAAGVVACADLQPHAASAKLRWALSMGAGPNEVRTMMRTPVDFDMCNQHQEALNLTA